MERMGSAELGSGGLCVIFCFSLKHVFWLRVLCGFKCYFHNIACEVWLSVLQQFQRQLWYGYSSTRFHSCVEGFPAAGDAFCGYSNS